MSNLKQAFISRFDDGYIIEADFSQLEVIGLAFVSQDPVLYQDLRDNIDMHCLGASWLTGEDYDTLVTAHKAGDEYWSNKRQDAKALNFALQYGAGAKTLSVNTGLPKALCQEFIERKAQRYKKVTSWQQSVSQSRSSYVTRGVIINKLISTVS